MRPSKTKGEFTQFFTIYTIDISEFHDLVVSYNHLVMLEYLILQKCFPCRLQSWLGISRQTLYDTGFSHKEQGIEIKLSLVKF
jgi:hypothetical protein